MLILLFAFAAGLVTVLAPCILPVLPIVLSGGVAKGRLRPWGIITGVILSFSVFTLALSWAVQQLGLSPNFSRNFGIVLLILIGVFFFVPGLMTKFEGWLSARLSRSGKPVERHGYWGGLLLGLGLGAVWTPCAGPILASVVAAAQTGTVSGQTVAVTIAYAVGAALPMGLIAILGQRILTRVRSLGNKTEVIQKIFGVVMIVVALMMATNLDRRVQSWLISVTPNWLPQLQQFEKNVDMKTSVRTSTQTNSGLKNYGPAPELTGITGWINSQPQTLAELRGKVVLVKFWTYTCINCIRTLPYVQTWYDKYHDQGFEIIAVHTPEFAFEKIPANVEQAVKDFRITYPVALDPDYATWGAYENRYWPAKYFIDAAGNIRYIHFGEGEYDETEKVIQELLRDAGQTVTNDLVSSVSPPFAAGQSPETYFGLARAERFSSVERLTNGINTYTVRGEFAPNTWAFEGKWDVDAESAVAAKGSSVSLRVRAQDVYFVLSGVGEDAQPLNVSVDGVGTTQFNVMSTVGNQTLYRVAQFPIFGEHILKVDFPQGGVRLFAATFGGGTTPGLACGTDGKCNVTALP